MVPASRRLIVALARKLLVALWRYVTVGVVIKRGDYDIHVGFLNSPEPDQS
jgi:hypothetical protein